MRLTLRTMLAYMDGILEPDDADDIGRKIKDSEFATGLMHRIRDVMRRLRLAAPGVAERGPGIDSNTVAEYLDNTLHDDRVADFEKVCLDSDVHLAEVASCHQVLTLVLGEAAEIDPGARQRMYGIPEVARRMEAIDDETPAAAEQPAATATVAETKPTVSAAHKRRDKPTVPDYLREPDRRRRWPARVGALVLVACLVVVVLIALGQFNPGTPLGNLLGVGPSGAEVAATEKDQAPGSPLAPRIPDLPPAAVPPAVASPTDLPGAEQGAVEPDKATDVASTVPTVKTPDDETSLKQPGVVQPPVEPVAAEPAVAEPLPSGTEPPVAPMPQDVAVNPPVPKTPGAEPLPPSVVPGEMPTEPSLVEPAPEPGETEPEGVAGTEPAVPGRQPPVPPVRMGRLMTEDQVLLSFDTMAGVWRRVAAKGILYPNGALLALPTFHPEVSLSNGVNMQMLGGAKLELLPAEAEVPSGIKVFYGRVFLMPLAEAGKQVRLVLGGHQGVLAFADAESIMAVDVVPVHLPGTNPEEEPALIVAELYARSGGLVWTEQVGGQVKTVRIEPQQRLVLDEQPLGEAVAVETLPAWITADVSETVSLLDRRAAPVIEQALPVDRSVNLSLRELADHRKEEVRWLAQRCLAEVDYFSPMVVVLNDASRKLDWPDYIEQLRAGIARDPKSAAAVRTALEKQYGQTAPELYRMLWGYTQDGLKAGDAGDLVGYLDSDNLALRVLSFWNLKDITGLGLFYRPEFTAAKRKQPVQKWKDRVGSGEIWAKPPGVHKLPEEPSAPELESPL